MPCACGPLMRDHLACRHCNLLPSAKKFTEECKGTWNVYDDVTQQHAYDPKPVHTYLHKITGII